MKSISIIIPCLMTKYQLKKANFYQKLKKKNKCEIIVINDGSSDILCVNLKV